MGTVCHASNNRQDWYTQAAFGAIPYNDLTLGKVQVLTRNRRHSISRNPPPYSSFAMNCGVPELTPHTSEVYSNRPGSLWPRVR
jgi:hypothetical protein